MSWQYSFCLHFVHLLDREPNLENFSIYSFIIYTCLESSFTCPGLQASGLARRLQYTIDHPEIIPAAYLIFISTLDSITTTIVMTTLYKYYRPCVRRHLLTELQRHIFTRLRQVGGFLRVLLFPPPMKLTATI